MNVNRDDRAERQALETIDTPAVTAISSSDATNLRRMDDDTR